MAAIPLVEEEFALLVSALDGTEKARTLAIAAFTLLVYEYTITLDKEIEYFWNGHWTISRVLYLVNRYLPILVSILVIVCFCMPNAKPQFCDRGIRASLVLEVIALAVIQAILVLRIWYLFSKNVIARCIAVASFVTATAITVTYVALSFGDLNSIAISIPGLRILGCTSPPPRKFWRFFLPSLILHTILFVCTTVHAISSREFLHSTPITKRLFRDGGLFYGVVFLVVAFSAIGAIFDHVPSVNIPAIYSGVMLSVMAVSISRVMLSIHSLASQLSSADVWLLNNGELSRVQWKHGARPGELIVDVGVVPDVELSSMLSDRIEVKTTQVGVYNDYTTSPLSPGPTWAPQ